MKVSKHRRLSKIIEVLERWAPLETSEICQHLAIAFSVQETDLRRNVLNDLKFLLDEGELSAFYLDKHENVVSRDLPPDEGNFYKIKWLPSNWNELPISGIKVLKDLKGDFYASPSLIKSSDLKAGYKEEGQDFFKVSFELNHELHSLRFNVGAKSDRARSFLKLAIGRGDLFAKDIRQAEDDKQAFLSLNDPFLSAFEKNSVPPIEIEYFENRTVTIRTQNKNDIFIEKLSAEQLSELIKQFTFLAHKTKTQHWTELTKKKESLIPLKQAETFHLPLLIKTKEGSGLILS